MGCPSSNVVRFVPRDEPSTARASAREDDLRWLGTMSSNLNFPKGPLIEAIANYSRDCIAVGCSGPTERLSTLLKPVETLEAGMHRLAGAMAAQPPR